MRGKHAASSASKRADNLSAEVDSLTVALAQEQEARALDARVHASEIGKMRSRISLEAKSLRDSQFNAAVESATRARVEKEIRSLVDSRLVEVAQILARGPFQVRESVALEQTLGAVAQALGAGKHGGMIVEAFYAARPGISTLKGNRAVRRTPAKMYRRDHGEFSGGGP